MEVGTVLVSAGGTGPVTKRRASANYPASGTSSVGTLTPWHTRATSTSGWR